MWLLKCFFLITSPDAYPPDAAFKVTPEDFEELVARDGIIQAPHLARNHWVKVQDINRLNKKQWEHYLRQSYNLVVAKLPKKVQATLTL